MIITGILQAEIRIPLAK